MNFPLMDMQSEPWRSKERYAVWERGVDGEHDVVGLTFSEILQHLRTEMYAMGWHQHSVRRLPSGTLRLVKGRQNRTFYIEKLAPKE